MNEKLSKELEAIINRDEQMRYNVLNRVEYLNCLKEDNKNIINLSLKNITNFMQNNGNKGCYIKVDNFSLMFDKFIICLLYSSILLSNNDTS